MNTKQRESIMLRAIQRFGVNGQMMKAAEEAGELVQAIVKHLLAPSAETRLALLDECADAAIMLEQIKLMSPYVAANLDGRIEHKLERLDELTMHAEER